jgi:cytochrome c oxidase assembly protein subunit 15
VKPAGDRAVGNWLLLLAFMVFGMTAGGGHVRTIGASFAIETWQPVTGFIPPLNAAAWAHFFALYQQTAQFQAQPVSLAQFKAMFWPMFWDRNWGRLMALVFLLPFAVFAWQRRLPKRLMLWVLVIFAAGGGQAAFGWYMVRTGLQPGVTMPPPLWAAPHFLSAMLIFVSLLWTGLTVKKPLAPVIEGLAWLRPWALAGVVLVFVTMGFGALVATTNAITVFHSFPLMDGHLVPPGLFALHPAWLNFFANKATVQFFHRLLATITVLTVLATAVLGLRATDRYPGLRDNFLLLAGLVALQYLLGMATMVMGAAELGYVHELNAVLLLAAAVCALHGLRGATPRRMLEPEIAAAE